MSADARRQRPRETKRAYQQRITSGPRGADGLTDLERELLWRLRLAALELVDFGIHRELTGVRMRVIGYDSDTVARDVHDDRPTTRQAAPVRRIRVALALAQAGYVVAPVQIVNRQRGQRWHATHGIVKARAA